MSDERFFFDSLCPYCQALRRVRIPKVQLKKALADDLPFEVSSEVCDHSWTALRAEAETLKKNPLLTK
jgi:hypothetical protein